MTQEEWAEVTLAAMHESGLRHIPYSRNNFCVRAVLAVVRSKAVASD